MYVGNFIRFPLNLKFIQIIRRAGNNIPVPYYGIKIYLKAVGGSEVQRKTNSNLTFKCIASPSVLL